MNRHWTIRRTTALSALAGLGGFALGTMLTTLGFTAHGGHYHDYGAPSSHGMPDGWMMQVCRTCGVQKPIRL